jgi:cell division protein FtsL
MKRRFVALWVAAICAAALAFVAHLALRFETVQLGYDVDRARQEQRRLVEQERLLSIEAATLRAPERVEAVARGRLGMDIPAPERVVTLGARIRRAAAGRVR